MRFKRYRGWSMWYDFMFLSGYYGCIEKPGQPNYEYDGHESEGSILRAMQRDIDKLEGVPVGIIGKPVMGVR